MGKKHKKGVKTLSLRLPQSVAVALQKRAKQANRSINKQIVHELTPVNYPTTTTSGSGFQSKVDWMHELPA